MAKKGKNKKACEKYRMSGHKAINKELRKERHEKRLAKFAKRKEEGKTYEYKANPYQKGTDEFVIEIQNRHEKYTNSGTKTDFQKFVSTMKKLDNWLKDEEKRLKEIKENKAKKNTKKSKRIYGTV